jgi:hypothetical protein
MVFVLSIHHKSERNTEEEKYQKFHHQELITRAKSLQYARSMIPKQVKVSIKLCGTKLSIPNGQWLTA